MIKNIGIIIISLIVLGASIIGCKKEDVILKDPSNYTRPINFAAPLINAKIGGPDMFEKIDSALFYYVDTAGYVHVQENYKSEFSMNLNFDVKKLIKSETSLNYLDELNIYIDFSNKLPVSGEGQIYVVNELGDTVETLFPDTQLFFEALITNSIEVPETPLITPFNIKLTQKQIKLWYDEGVTEIHFNITNTAGGTTADPNSTKFIVFSPECTLGIKLSVELKSDTTTK